MVSDPYSDVLLGQLHRWELPAIISRWYGKKQSAQRWHTGLPVGWAARDPVYNMLNKHCRDDLFRGKMIIDSLSYFPVVFSHKSHICYFAFFFLYIIIVFFGLDQIPSRGCWGNPHQIFQISKTHIRFLKPHIRFSKTHIRFLKSIVYFQKTHP